MERIYEQYPDMQGRINSLTVDVCGEENVSPEKVFFVLFYHNGLFQKKSWHKTFCVSRKQCTEISGIDLKRNRNYSGDHAEL